MDTLVGKKNIYHPDMDPTKTILSRKSSRHNFLKRLFLSDYDKRLVHRKMLKLKKPTSEHGGIPFDKMINHDKPSP